MTEQLPVHAGFPPPLAARLDRYFLTMGMGVNAHALTRDRRELLLWFDAKSDADLALMGLARPDIPSFVFQDLFGNQVRPRIQR